MKASVVIPVRNMPEYVAECIGSILRQTLADFEVIVVDDCSTDNTADVVRGFTDPRVRLLQHPENRGVSAAVNTGMLAATGDYVCALGADDLLMPWMLEKQSAYLDANPACAAVFGLPISMNDDGTPLIHKPDKFTQPANRSRSEWLATLLEGNTLMAQTMLYRRSLHDEIGLWDESLSSPNDVDFFIRIVKAHDIHVQHIPMAAIRIRGDDKTQLSADTQANRGVFAGGMAYIREKHAPAQPKIDFAGKLIIATPLQDGLAPMGFVNSLLASVRCLEALGIEWDWWGFEANADREREKNSICAKFLEDETATDLLFARSDLEWKPLGLLRLLQCPEEIVGGAALEGERWNAGPVLKNGIPQGVMRGDAPLLKTEFLSSAFLRVKKSALRRFRDAHPGLWYKDEHAGMSDDYLVTAFFENVRDGETVLSGDEAFCARWLEMGGTLWIEPQIEFRTRMEYITTRSLDAHYRDLKESQRLPMAA